MKGGDVRNLKLDHYSYDEHGFDGGGRSDLFVESSGTVAPIQSSVGPVSGINYQTLITELEASQQLQVTNIQNQISTDQTQQGDYQTLAANLSTLATSLQTLGTSSTFQNYQVQISDPNQLSVTATSGASPGSYQFQSVQLASSQVSLSQGFANATTQTLGTGTLTIASGGGLAPPTLLDALNGDQGVQLGSIQITDAAGHTADINLSTAYTVNDVINAINNNGVADVTASTEGGHIVLTDTSGGSGSLTVANLNGDQTATNLGINQTSSSGTITGQNVYQATTTTDLSQINDRKRHLHGRLGRGPGHHALQRHDVERQSERRVNRGRRRQRHQ